MSHLTHDRQIIISVGKNRKATQWDQKQLSLSEFYAMLSTPRHSPETQAEYLAMPKAQQDDLKDVGGFVGGSLNGSRRKADSVAGRDLITLDFDSIPPGQTEEVTRRVEALGCGYCIYSTRKHKPSAPRLRVVIPFDKTAAPDEYAPLARLAAWRIGMEWIDPTTFDVARLMYWPSCCSDSEFIFKSKDAPLLAVDKWLDMHTVLCGDWKNPANWLRPANAAEDRISQMAKKQGDPLEKSGIVGAFCRSYSIHRAIAKLLPGVYEPVDNAEDRYTFVGGSTTGGAIVYDGGKFLYSHHATDPCSGRLVNAFDLVRLHLFGKEDDSAAPGTPVGRLPSYTAMRDYAQSLPDVHAGAASAAADFAGLESTAGEDESWKKQLDIAPAGGLKNSLNNIAVILEHDARFRGKLRKDVFHDRIEVDTMPWERERGKPFDDTDVDHMRLWMERTLCGKVAAADVYTATNATADKRSYHPVRDYLERLAWDGTPRLDTLFIDYLGAEDTPYTRAVSRKAFVAAVARIMNPGCKFDCMTVLVGKQGRFKSTILSIMGGSWFSDSQRTFEGKEAEERLRGVWLIEVSELQAFDRSSVEAIKGFLSKQSDRYRPAYGHALREFPRQCVFFGTTNVADFLRDTTGGRRFWPIDIDRQERTKSVANDLQNERDQIWAEAVTRFREGEPLYLSGDVAQAALSTQEDHREIDTWEEMLHSFIEKPIPDNWDEWTLAQRRDFLAGQAHTDRPLVERERVSAAEFLCEALGLAPGKLSTHDTMRVSKLLRGLPDWEPLKGRYRTPYAQPRGYIRKK